MCTGSLMCVINFKANVCLIKNRKDDERLIITTIIDSLILE